MVNPTQIYHLFRWFCLSVANTQRLEGRWKVTLCFRGVSLLATARVLTGLDGPVLSVLASSL